MANDIVEKHPIRTIKTPEKNRYPEVQRALRQNSAENAINQKYAALGGKRSSFGLPLASKLQLNGDDCFIEYRGGTITVKDFMNADNAVAVTQKRAEVWWVGLECVVRQEGEDEIYGTVNTIVPGTGLSNTHKFPGDRDYWMMGKDGSRIVNTAVPIYEGPPMDIVVSCSLVEHDSGDIEKYKRAVADQIAKVAEGFAAMAGVPAEAVASDQGFIGDLSLGLVNSISDALGMQDDQYNPGTLLLNWSDILSHNFMMEKENRADDPKTIEYTHKVIVTGTDNGGDTGEYRFYFAVKLTDVTQVF